MLVAMCQTDGEELLEGDGKMLQELQLAGKSFIKTLTAAKGRNR